MTKIIFKLNDDSFYSSFLDELQVTELPNILKNESYKVKIGLRCRAAVYHVNDVTTESIKKLHEYLRKEFNVKSFGVYF